MIAATAEWLGKDRKLAQSARWVAFSGSIVSTGLLISDLGRPARFLNMLRVFKMQSPMSMGAWTLAAFGAASGAAAFAKAAEHRFGSAFPVRVIGNFGHLFSAFFGLPFHNYTGVLIGATAIPVWNKNIHTLPIHFGMSGVQAGVSVLELLGHDGSRALNSLGIGSAVYETLEGLNLERRTDSAFRPLKHGASGWITRTGRALSGPVALSLRLLAPEFRKVALARPAALGGNLWYCRLAAHPLWLGARRARLGTGLATTLGHPGRIFFA